MGEQPAAEKVCPECAETVKLEARVCRFCGYRFEPEAHADTAFAPAQAVPVVLSTAGFGRRQWFVVWGLASVLLMLIGSFGPWLTALGSSVGGTDGSNDGWVVVAAGVIGGLIFVTTRSNRGAGLWALIAGVIAAIVTIHDRSHVSSVISQSGAFAQALVHVGWGLNLAMVASISFALCGLVWLFSMESETPQ